MRYAPAHYQLHLQQSQRKNTMAHPPQNLQAFKPRDPDYRLKVESSFNRQQAMHSLGITIAELRPGFIALEMPHNSDFTQQHGFMHAGIITTALDSACGYAAFSLMEPDAAVLSVEFKANFLAPAEGALFRFEAAVLKPGRTLTVCEAKAYAIQDVGQDAGQDVMQNTDSAVKGRKLVASMTATIMALAGREDVKE